jgi:hypothetical protein
MKAVNKYNEAIAGMHKVCDILDVKYHNNDRGAVSLFKVLEEYNENHGDDLDVIEGMKYYTQAKDHELEAYLLDR